MSAQSSRSLDLVARILAERLREPEPSSELRTALSATDNDWDEIVGQASENYVLAALAAAVRDLGLAGSVEPELYDFLAAVHAANAERNLKLRDQLAEVVATLNGIGIEPVLLKGAVRLVDGLYPDPGWRMMRDLDLLVPEAKLDETVEGLRKVGYAPHRPPATNHTAWRQHNYPGLACPGGVAVIEIHTELFSSERRRRLLRGAGVLRAARCVEFDGVVARIPSLEHQMRHLIAHCQISDWYRSGGKSQLRDLLEAAALDVWSPERVAWRAVCAAFADAGYRGPLIVFLLRLEGAGFSPVPKVAKIGPLARLARRNLSHGSGPTRLDVDWWAALVRDLVLDPEMRRRVFRRSAEACLQRRHPPT